MWQMSLEALSVPGSLFEAPYSSASSASRLWDRRSVFPLINASYVAPVSCHGRFRCSTDVWWGVSVPWLSLFWLPRALWLTLSLPLYPESAYCASEDSASLLFICRRSQKQLKFLVLVWIHSVYIWTVSKYNAILVLHGIEVEKLNTHRIAKHGVRKKTMLEHNVTSENWLN